MTAPDVFWVLFTEYGLSSNRSAWLSGWLEGRKRADIRVWWDRASFQYEPDAVSFSLLLQTRPAVDPTKLSMASKAWLDAGDRNERIIRDALMATVDGLAMKE